MSPVGYSGTPLVKKLGIKEGFQCLLINEPTRYFNLIIDIPVNTYFTDKAEGNFDFIHAFFAYEKELTDLWPILKSALKKDGSLWISWPKGSSKLEKDINENDVRRIGLKGGLVDVKVCAVDKDWSGLKFMYRKKDR